MIKVLFNLLGGSVADKLADAYKAHQVAKTDQERILAEQRIKLLQSQEAIIVAEQANWTTRWIRPFLAAPFGIYIWKVLVWDKVLKLGTTDPLSPLFTEMMMWVVGAYFVGRGIEKGLKYLRG